MREVSNKIKRRFIKDMGLSGVIVQEPYFSERLELFGYKDIYNRFIKQLEEKGMADEEYLDYYDNLKYKVINYIINTETYKTLNSVDITSFNVKSNYPHCEPFKDCNVGHQFISIDLKEANYTALREYCVRLNKSRQDVFMDVTDKTFGLKYEDLIKKFTDFEVIVKSKYFRQVVFGNCNPKRQIKFERLMMEEIINKTILKFFTVDKIYSVVNDEIIIDADEVVAGDPGWKKLLYSLFTELQCNYRVKVNFFTLLKVEGTDGYLVKDDNEVKVKCATPQERIFIQRLLNGEEIRDTDLVFEFEHKLVKYLEKPEIKIVGV